MDKSINQPLVLILLLAAALGSPAAEAYRVSIPIPSISLGTGNRSSRGQADRKKEKLVYKNLQKARKLIKQKRYEEALSLLKQLRRYDPNLNSGVIRGQIARIYYMNKNYRACVAAALDGLKHDRDMDWVVWYLGRANLKMGQLQTARRWYKQYINMAKGSGERKKRQREMNDDIAFSYLDRASTLLDDNKRVDAKLLLEKAKELPPSEFSGAIHQKLAYVFYRFGNADKTIEEAKACLEQEPRNKYAMRFMAAAYERLGDLDQAIEWRRKVAGVTKDQKEKKDMLEHIQALLDDKDKLASIDASGSDYLDELSEVHIWRTSSMPIKVFIPISHEVPGYRGNFPEIFFRSLIDWRRASGNKVAFQILPNPQGADMIVEWTASPISMVQKGRLRADKAGTARTATRRGTGRYPFAVDSKIRLKTTESLDNKPLSDDELRSTCLHEIGHALGLSGHSRNVHDMMYFQSSMGRIPALSKRDKATMKRLYKEHPVVSSPTDSYEGSY